MNGMSAMTKARFVPRVTAFTWWSMSAIETGISFSYPRITRPTESPTSSSGMPASSSSRAVG